LDDRGLEIRSGMFFEESHQGTPDDDPICRSRGLPCQFRGPNPETDHQRECRLSPDESKPLIEISRE